MQQLHSMWGKLAVSKKNDKSGTHHMSGRKCILADDGHRPPGIPALQKLMKQTKARLEEVLKNRDSITTGLTPHLLNMISCVAWTVTHLIRCQWVQTKYRLLSRITINLVFQW